MEALFLRLWYHSEVRLWPLQLLLYPLSLLFCLLVTVRRTAYRLGWLSQQKMAVPVIVVGNITIGGTGKTPLVIYLAKQLQQQGLKPAIISRGYGRKDESQLLAVKADSTPEEVGDEPLLLASLSGAPVWVCSDRVAAVEAARQQGADIILSDDGLQHYRLGRELEIVVVDGVRQWGNRLCLPAGPLREPLNRLQQADLVVENGTTMQLQPGLLYPLHDQNRQEDLAAWKGQRAHAVAGIGHPQRFFDLLSDAGISVIPHPMGDHHQYNESDFEAMEGAPILMTEKDAVKCRHLSILEGLEVWVMPVEATLEPPLQQQLFEKIQEVTQRYG